MDNSTHDDTRLANSRRAKGGCFKYLMIGLGLAFGLGFGFLLALTAMIVITATLNAMTGKVDEPVSAEAEDAEDVNKNSINIRIKL